MNKNITKFNLILLSVLLSTSSIVMGQIATEQIKPKPDANIIVIETTGCGKELSPSQCTARKSSYKKILAKAIDSIKEIEKNLNDENKIPTYIYAMGFKTSDNTTLNKSILEKITKCGINEYLEKNDLYHELEGRGRTENLPISGNFESNINNKRDIIYQCWKYERDVKWENNETFGISDTNSASFTLKKVFVSNNSKVIAAYQLHPQLIAFLPSLLKGFENHETINSFDLYLISDTRISSLETNLQNQTIKNIGYIANKNSYINQIDGVKWGNNKKAMLNKWHFEKRVILPEMPIEIKPNTDKIEIPYVSNFYKDLKLTTQNYDDDFKLDKDKIISECSRDNKNVTCTFKKSNKKELGIDILYDGVTEDKEETIYLSGYPIDNVPEKEMRLHKAIKLLLKGSLLNIREVEPEKVTIKKFVNNSTKVEKGQKIKIFTDKAFIKELTNTCTVLDEGNGYGQTCELEKKLSWGSYYFKYNHELVLELKVTYFEWNSFSELATLNVLEQPIKFSVCDGSKLITTIQDPNSVGIYDSFINKLKIIWHKKEKLLVKEGEVCFIPGKKENGKPKEQPTILAHVIIKKSILNWIRNLIILAVILISVLLLYGYRKRKLNKFRSTPPTITVEDTEDYTNA